MSEATPAQIANDMAAHAAYWCGRDRAIERACGDAARMIRMFLAGDHVDGRTYGGLHKRLLDLGYRGEATPLKGFPDFDRARLCLERLRREVSS